MLHFYLLAAQIMPLIIIAILLWQIIHFLKRAEIPEDELLGEKRARYLTHRLTAISVCAVIEALLCIAQAILRLL